MGIVVPESSHPSLVSKDERDVCKDGLDSEVNVLVSISLLLLPLYNNVVKKMSHTRSNDDHISQCISGSFLLQT